MRSWLRDDERDRPAGTRRCTGVGGDDTLAGGEGDDALDGGDGFDFAENYFQNAFMPSEPLAGPMTVNLTTGTSTGNGTDTLVDIEAASGSLGNDVMTGNAGDNAFVVLNEGADAVDAGPGDDLVDGGNGADHLDGGAGTDQFGNLDATKGMTIDLSIPSDSHGDTLSGFEDLIGTIFHDVLTGTAVAEVEEVTDQRVVAAEAGQLIVAISPLDPVRPLGGADSADGGVGTDACDAEIETNCETEPSPPPMLPLARQAVAMKMS